MELLKEKTSGYMANLKADDYRDFIEFLVKCGVDRMSVRPGTPVKSRSLVAEPAAGMHTA